MRDELLGYYERELSYLRQLGAEFAQKYPKIAARLQLEPDRCEDPHVERMIEAVAFLASRVHLKIDDEFPELTESLLSVLYPHFLAPIPSASVVQFVVDAEHAQARMGQTIATGSMLRSSPVDGYPCRFRTCYPVTIWPVEVAAVRFELPGPGMAVPAGTRSLLRIELRTMGTMRFAELQEKGSEGEPRPFDRLRFYLQGESKLQHALYELFGNDVTQIALAGQAAAGQVVLPREALRSVGFERDEGLLPYGDRSFLGYRLLQEYLTFPEKFFFFDVAGLDRAVRAGAGGSLELLFALSREFPLERNVNAQTFRLHCAPIVNLFSQVAEPIRVTQLQSQYRVIPDVGRSSSLEVYSVDAVTGLQPELEQPVVYRPFYSVKHGIAGEEGETFWHPTRRPSQRKDDEGTEVYLTLVDLGFNPSVPRTETLKVEATCTNRDLPARLPFGSAAGDFELEAAGVFSSIRCLRKPTPTVRAPMRRGVQWRLISHLSLNYLSLVEGDQGPEALQEILKLYDFADTSVNRQQIAGITGLKARRVLRPVGSAQSGFVRGLEVSAELDEQQFIGGGVFLLASVLERFLGLYASINSFSQLVLSTRQREGVVKRWPPRAGEQIVL
jgi:type VI secretion system protein ImpG